MSHLPNPSSSDYAEEIDTNPSSNPHIRDLIEARLLTRRQILQGGLGATAAAIFGGGAMTLSTSARAGVPTLGFAAVPKTLADTVSVPAGYRVQVLYALGDPIDTATPAFLNDGTDSGFYTRAGDHHDGMYFFGMRPDGTPDRKRSNRGLLCINHENITPVYLHPAGPTSASGVRPAAEVIKEMQCHGVSVIEIAKDKAGTFQVDRGSPRNRRITPLTPIRLAGPVAGSDAARTRYSSSGKMTLGTVNNCASGFTPWGTYLTCEENWAGYFKRPTATDNPKRSAKEITSLTRYGVTSSSGNYGWSTPDGDAFKRWDASVSAESADLDSRNGPNTYGYIVEIDPFKRKAPIKKRTALGRFNHEGCWPAKAVAGKPVVFYMGDDARGEYIYKWVSKSPFDPKRKGIAAGDDYLDRGTLYVARFHANGSGAWLPLVFGQNGLDASNSTYSFADAADLCINTRLAADSLGATRMDRPEWGAVNPLNGEVYFTLTNNSNRRVVPGTGQIAVDAANPRAYTDLKGSTTQNGNVNGHIIRWREAGDDPAADQFTWDVYAFGAEAGADTSAVNLSGLDASNDFSSPDGLWFARAENASKGLLWIQTDDGAYTDVTNCMMLAAVPGSVGDGESLAVNGVTTYKGANPGTLLRRFLVGPKGCEITGIDSTPDGKALFVNIQHPGEDGSLATLQSSWPAQDGVSRPRSATLVITRDDGGVVGIA